MKPKYYLAKTIIGSDEDYLPLLENIVWMPKMTDPAKGNLEAFLIVDEESIEMMKSTPRNAEGNYYDFVLSTGVELITINQLIDRVASDELRDNAHFVYQKLRDATKVNFPQLGDFEVLPISSQADFTKALFLHGFSDQDPESVNICEDLDVFHDQPSKLPDEPKDFLRDKVSASGRTVSYSASGVLKFTKEDLDLVWSDEKVFQMWGSYQDRLFSGKTHDAFVTKEVALQYQSEGKIVRNSEYSAAKSGALTLEKSVSDLKSWLILNENTLQVTVDNILLKTKLTPEEKIQIFNNVLKEQRKMMVDQVVCRSYLWWQEDHEPLEAILDPRELGISGRYDSQKWKDVSLEGKGKIYYSPNIESAQDYEHPWTQVIKGFADVVRRERDAASSQVVEQAEVNFPLLSGKHFTPSGLLDAKYQTASDYITSKTNPLEKSHDSEIYSTPNASITSAQAAFIGVALVAIAGFVRNKLIPAKETKPKTGERLDGEKINPKNKRF